MILNLEDQVCSLESSKRLRELGCPQESLFYWKDSRDLTAEFGSMFENPELRISPNEASAYRINEPERKSDTSHSRTYSAYTVAELGELLPQGWGTPFKHTDGKEWAAVYKNYCDYWRTEAEARAKTLIYLYKQGLI